MAHDVDWKNFIINYRNYLRRKGQSDLAGLLKNAQATQYTIQVDHDEYMNRLSLRIPNNLIHEYDDDKYNDILLNAAKVLVPDAYLDQVRVGSLLDETSEDGTAVIVDNPYFGSPSKESRFACDVFVIMPFAPEFKPIYSDHFATTAKELGLTIKRGDDFFSQRSVMNDVWTALNACRLVIAECTGRNPNVFYELGIAHTLAKPVVLITQKIDDIPFDLRHLRHVEYMNTLAGAVAFKKISLKQLLIYYHPKSLMNIQKKHRIYRSSLSN